MSRRHRWILTASVVSALSLTGWSNANASEQGASEEGAVEGHQGPPAVVEPTEDSGVSRITLTERAAERLGIKVAKVGSAGGLLTAPFGALLYDADGGEWVYTSPAPRVFRRSAVDVERVTDGTLYLKSGPPVGTDVVVVGAPELFGAEFEIGH
jgi:hypothetical protein